MNLSFNNIIFKALVVLALMIVGITLWYTNNLANKLKKEEYSKVALWAKATKELSNISNSNYDISFVFEVVNNNTTVPAIHTNSQGEIIAHRNISKSGNNIDLEKELTLMSRKYSPIEIELIDGTKEFIYYKDSRLLQQLKQFPFFMLSIIGAFMLIAYFAFSNARVAQQNKVWTGMAKETAHQIGTPLSSLIGWIEYLKQKKLSESITKEMEKDVDRLTVIASRFSKIGSSPILEAKNIVSLLKKSANYMQQRLSSKIDIQVYSNKPTISTRLNTDLFEWVIENIIKNSADAISEKGTISINVTDAEKQVLIDIVDDGKGIKQALFSEIFKPGFTSKKRGWGLGLSLVKRIVKDYHGGMVKILKSNPYKETILRIVLNK